MNIKADFLIAGAAKCGTTALWAFLNKHPQVCMSQNKEPRFFTNLKGEFDTSVKGGGLRFDGTYKKGFDWYNSLFDQSKENQICGEASTCYFFAEDSAELIYNNKLDMKLIFMLRDPVKRLYSHYWQEYKLGYDFPSFEEMVNTNHPRLKFYINTSNYKKNLERYFKVFPKEQILVIIHEDFIKSPKDCLNTIQNFLKIEPIESDFIKRVNDSAIPRNKRFARLLSKAQSSSLKKIIPAKLTAKLGQIRNKIVQYNLKKSEYPKISDETYNKMRNLFVHDIEFVENYLKRKLPW